jgi:hypothetical protein
VLTLAIFIGGSLSAVIFRYRSDRIASYFGLPILSRFQLVFLFSAYVLPVLCSYLVFYLLNRILIRVFDSNELQEAKRSIAEALLDAASRQGEVYANPTNLMEETAWIDLKKYWRPK